MKIKSVVIVGGGSSGWMTAAALSKLCPNIKLTLVEDPNTKTVGVGESTLGQFNAFLQLLDLEDRDWMPKCNATYKNSIRFTNFREGRGESFEYPFGRNFNLHYAFNGLNTWSQISTLDPDNYPPESFAEFYNNNTFLAKYNRQTKEMPGFNFKNDTAYHLDAELFGEFLRDRFCKDVKHVSGRVVSCDYHEDGRMNRLFLDTNVFLTSDLFIDCTGFKSVLLENLMGQKFIPFTTLANDKAIATKIPYVDEESQMVNVTDCRAMDNGWVWNIPLWNRMGTGYCYSSRFCDHQSALEEFKSYLGVDDMDYTSIDIRHGKREKAWVKNVVGVGLSYGFIEPLESTGLLTTHENIVKLVGILNQRDGYVSSIEVEGFNYTCDYDLQMYVDFVALHYALSMRTDTPYWNWCTQECEYKSSMNFLANTITNHNWFADMAGVLYIAAGHGLKSTSFAKMVEVDLLRSNVSMDTVHHSKRSFELHKEWMTEHMKTLPSHYQFLKEEIYS